MARVFKSVPEMVRLPSSACVYFFFSTLRFHFFPRIKKRETVGHEDVDCATKNLVSPELAASAGRPARGWPLLFYCQCVAKAFHLRIGEQTGHGFAD